MSSMTFSDLGVLALKALAALSLIYGALYLFVIRKRRKAAAERRAEAAKQQTESALEALEPKLQRRYVELHDITSLNEAPAYSAWRQSYIKAMEQAHGPDIWQKCVDEGCDLPPANAPSPASVD